MSRVSLTLPPPPGAPTELPLSTLTLTYPRPHIQNRMQVGFELNCMLCLASMSRGLLRCAAAASSKKPLLGDFHPQRIKKGLLLPGESTRPPGGEKQYGVSREFRYSLSSGWAEQRLEFITAAMTQTFGIEPHPYYPEDAYIPGYVPNESALGELLLRSGAVLSITIITAVWLATSFNRRLSLADKFIFGWFVLCKWLTV